MTETTGELTADQLAKLLAAALGEDDAQHPDETNADARAEALAAAMECTPGPAQGREIRDVLLDARADVDELQAVKDLGRRLAESPSELDRPAGTVLYYAAIARALHSAGERITRHDPASLALSLADLAGREWIPSDLRAVLSAGQDACRSDETE
jgi:hypothetical protein